MAAKIQIVDRGRGLQLSTNRITVQDLVPYFQEGASCDEIIRWIPTLSADEIAVVEAYYRAHQAELDDQDRRIRERSAHRTVADIRSVVTNPEYRHRVIDRLLRYLLEMDNIRGTGRLFLP